MRELDHAYRLLDLEPGASLEDINQAYKDLVFVWHPDRIPQDNERLYQKAQDKIKALNHARDLLRSHSRNGSSNGSADRSGATSYRSPAASRYGTGAYGSSAYTSAARPQPDSDDEPRSTYNNRYYRYQRSGYGSSYSQTKPADSAADATTDANGPSQTYRQRRDAAAGVGGAKSSGPQSEAKPANGSASHGSASHGATGSAAQGESRPKPPSDAYNSYNAHTRNGASSTHRSRQSPDLSGTDLRGANLREKDFGGRNLSGADLSGADLSDAFLHKVNLNRANLSKAKLFRANLLQADLSHANLREADLIGADFSGADLSGADLSGAKVAVGGRTMVKLTGTILTGAIMPDGSIHD